MARPRSTSLKAPKHLGAALAGLRSRINGEVPLTRIPREMTFRQWCEELARDRIDPQTGQVLKGLRVDGQPFKLDDRPAMAWIYDQVPCTPEEARGRRLVLMKCAQVGFTVLEMLAAIYMALKFEPIGVGFYLPSMALARDKSSHRFLPIVRTIPTAYELLTAPDPEALRPLRSEGNVLHRRMGGSHFYFLWTSGSVMTESNPMGVICLDEVQEMSISAIEKVHERLSGSRIKFTLMGSTANQPENDIDHFYRQGDQWRFHTRCPDCGAEEPLDAYFPACIGFDPEHPNPETGRPGCYRYRCRAGHWIDEPQVGAWRPTNPNAAPRTRSIHFHQMLSPTITPEEIYLAYLNAQDIKNFYNRKLGKPYQDPTELPVSEAHLAACVDEGARMGLVWKTSGSQTFMGIDQMGGFNCVVVKERLPDGRHAVVHVEEIYGDAPFDRCSELMQQFGVQVCVVEQLPNVNDARRFAKAHDGRVFLAGYGDIEDGIAHWGDNPRLTVNQRRTDEAERDRWTVRIDQYKAMSSTLRRIAAVGCLFPNPMALVQEVREKAAAFQTPILKDRVFPHLMRTALVTKRANELERRYRRAVEKRGKDPHHAFTFMLCDVAMSRAYGTAMFLLPDPSPPTHPTTPDHHPVIQLIRRSAQEGTCGRCANYAWCEEEATPAKGVCAIRPATTHVADGDIACPEYVPRS
jgi:hypothetical protein